MRHILLTYISSVVAFAAAADEVRIYEEHFTKGQEPAYIIVDANHDKNTWVRHTQMSWFGGEQDFEEMQYGSNATTQAGNDWILTPELMLSAGRTYSFSMRARSSFDGYAQRLRVCVGSGTSLSDYQTEVIAATNVSSSDMQTLTGVFTVEADGSYRIGVQALTPAHQEYVYVDDLVLTESRGAVIPAAVSQLTVTPDPSGALTATITCIAPSQTFDGQPLSGELQLELLRDGQAVYTQSHVQPGAQVTMHDAVSHVGTFGYAVVAIAGGRGPKVEAQPVYVGVDMPLPPAEFTLTDLGHSIRLDWSPVADRGQHGHPVGSVSYMLRLLDDNYFVTQELGTTHELTYLYDYETNRGDQDFLRFGVAGVNAAGWGAYAVARIVIGRPYNLPYHESFASGTHKTLTWQEGEGSFGMTTQLSADNDYGCIACIAQHPGQQATLCLGKISLRQAVAPRLTFQWLMRGADDRLTVRMKTPDGHVTDMQTLCGSCDEWQTVTVDLSSLAGADYVVPQFFYTGSQDGIVLIDDITISDPLPYDLAVDIEAPETFSVGQSSASCCIQVSNVGNEPVSGYEVEVRCQDQLVGLLSAHEPVLPGQTQTHTLALPTIVSEVGDVLRLRAELRALYDLNDANNVATWLSRLTPATPGSEGPAVSGIETIGVDPQRQPMPALRLTDQIYVIDHKKIMLR